MENDTAKTTAAWVKSENEITFGFLNKIPTAIPSRSGWRRFTTMNGSLLLLKKEIIIISTK